MVTVLIPTHLEDIHALAVGHALKVKGHQPILCYGSDFPTRQLASINIESGAQLNWELTGAGLNMPSEKFDVVWYRRPTPPNLPEDMHSGDRVIADRECKTFIKALWHLLAPDAFWVNPLSSRERVNLKPLQLQKARNVGLNIPPTLCSNDPDAIRCFIEKYKENVIYKPFMPAQWDKGDEGIALLFTSAITSGDLPEAEILRLSPGIFQPRLEKKYEVRATYMGDYCIAVKLLSQEAPASQLDWRRAFTSLGVDLDIDIIKIPQSVDRGCRKLMREFGIVFGCFDFIVTMNDDYIFLEVNEMGQFLWIEEMNPDILMLDPFVDFLINGNLNFGWRPSRASLMLKNFRSEIAHRHIEEDFKLHLPRQNSFSVSDAA